MRHSRAFYCVIKQWSVLFNWLKTCPQIINIEGNTTIVFKNVTMLSVMWMCTFGRKAFMLSQNLITKIVTCAILNITIENIFVIQIVYANCFGWFVQNGFLLTQNDESLCNLTAN